MTGIEKRSAWFNQEAIKFAVLDYGKGEKLFSGKQKSQASVSCCIEIRMYAFVMIWKLSRLEIK